MPLIPRLQPSETGPVAGAVLDRERRPTVDTREVSQAAANLGNVRQPTVNGAVMAAPFDALGSIGKAVMETGGILGARAIKQREAESDMQVARAQERMEAARAEFETWAMTDTNPGGWTAAWDERWTEARAQILDDETLNNGARQRLGIIAEQYGGAARVDVAKSAAKRSFAMAGSSYDARITRAIAVKDYDQAVNLSREKTGKGYGWDHETAALEADVQKFKERDETEALQTALYDEANADPRAFLEKYKERGDMDPAIHSRMVNHAQQVDREAVASDADKFQEAIANGTLTVPLEVDKWDEANPRITASMRERMKAHVARRRDVIEQERQRANAPENVSRLLSEISDLDPAKSTDEQFLKIDLAIKELPEGYRDTPYRRLHRKWRQQETPYTEAGLDELGDGILDSMLKSGAFGRYENEVPVKDKNGNPVLEPSTQLPKTETVRDPKAWESAIAAKSATGGKLARWLKANPKATPEQVQARLYEIAPEGTRAGMFDEFDRIPNAVDAAMKTLEFTPVRVPGGATTPGDPRGNDMLPDTPGPGENILLPFPPPPQ